MHEKFFDVDKNISENEKSKGSCNNHKRKKQDYGVKIPEWDKKWHAKKTYAAA